jgi:hypothetical protein
VGFSRGTSPGPSKRPAGRTSHGTLDGNHWDYYTGGPGERVVLANGAELDIDAIFEGVFALAGD